MSLIIEIPHHYSSDPVWKCSSVFKDGKRLPLIKGAFRNPLPSYLHFPHFLPKKLRFKSIPPRCKWVAASWGYSSGRDRHFVDLILEVLYCQIALVKKSLEFYLAMCSECMCTKA